jgi:hypothetical protein
MYSIKNKEKRGKKGDSPLFEKIKKKVACPLFFKIDIQNLFNYIYHTIIRK